MKTAVIYAACGTGFTYLMTVLGAAFVFLFRKEREDKVQKIFLGFAAGVMMAASVWSLLLPAIEGASRLGKLAFVPAAAGFALGGVFLMGLDRLVCRAMERSAPVFACSVTKGDTLLIAAVTLHNIPEGMAVGLAFALAAQHPEEMGYYAAAFALALGIGIQNLPEGSAVALPLCQRGMGPKQAFLTGSLSGIVEPVFGVGVTFLAAGIRPFMPWLLSFAAGAMIYVVAAELIPAASEGERTQAGTLGVMAGFLVMMILDVALG